MIIAFTGAGISKASGISTFMEQPEIRDRLHRSFAQKNPEAYRMTIKQLKNSVDQARINDAHQALLDFEIPVITMNIDGLHEEAGSDVIALHGKLPEDHEMSYCDTLLNKPVLYGDPAPNYHKAYQLVDTMKKKDTLLVIGASEHTAIAQDIRQMARAKGAEIIEIQDNAEKKTREVLVLLQQPTD